MISTTLSRGSVGGIVGKELCRTECSGRSVLVAHSLVAPRDMAAAVLEAGVQPGLIQPRLCEVMSHWALSGEVSPGSTHLNVCETDQNPPFPSRPCEGRHLTDACESTGRKFTGGLARILSAISGILI